MAMSRPYEACQRSLNVAVPITISAIDAYRSKDLYPDRIEDTVIRLVCYMPAKHPGPHLSVRPLGEAPNYATPDGWKVVREP